MGFLSKITIINSGWGRTARNQTVSEHLLQAGLKIVDFDECAQKWSGAFRLSIGMICAADEDSSACHVSEHNAIFTQL